MVASWRVMIVSSAALTRFGIRRSSMFMPLFFSSSRMTWRPAVLELLHHGRLADAGDRCPPGAGRRRRRPCTLNVGCGGHHAATGSGRSSAFSTRRRSSAGWLERDSAVAIVMWPALTSPASEVSIVCMPCWAPVWISE